MVSWGSLQKEDEGFLYSMPVIASHCHRGWGAQLAGEGEGEVFLLGRKVGSCQWSVFSAAVR